MLDGGRVYTILEVAGGLDPHRDDPLYARVSAPLLTQHDEAARQYVARVMQSLAREQKGLAPDSAAYKETASLLLRLQEWEAQYA